MAYGRPRYKRTINPEFKAGLEVDWVSGFARGSSRPAETRRVVIDRVLGTGHAVVKMPRYTKPGEPQEFNDVKFVLDGNAYAYQIGEGHYKASIWLLTPEYLAQKGAEAIRYTDQQRRRAIGEELKQLPIYSLTPEQMNVLEGIINSFKTPKE